MAGYCKKFKIGDLVLDCSDWMRKWRPTALAPVYRVERVTTCFYGFSRGGRIWLRKAEAMDPRLILVPPEIPWSFPAAFSDFCELGEVRYCSRRWRFMEVGYRFPARFEELKDDFSAKTYRLPKDYSFQPCGYGICEEVQGTSAWFWAKDTIDLLAHLRARAKIAESTPTAVADDLPAKLVERGSTEWNPRGATAFKEQLKVEDFFSHPAFGFPWASLSPVAGFTKDGKVTTTRGYVVDWDNVYEPPTALPPEVLRHVQLVSPVFSFAEAVMWAAFSSTVPRHEEVLYYTNDRIHWFRRLSDALQMEIGQLALTRSGGLPQIN